MKKNDSNKTEYKQNLKPYNPIKLAVYGKMVKLTANGSGSAQEPNAQSAKPRP